MVAKQSSSSVSLQVIYSLITPHYKNLIFIISIEELIGSITFLQCLAREGKEEKGRHDPNPILHNSPCD